jgi:hypothetical protein
MKDPNYIRISKEEEKRNYLRTSSSNPSYFKECGANCPVENINISEIEDFIELYCTKSNYGSQNCPYRLPTN